MLGAASLFNYLYLVPRVFLFARVTYFVLLCCITGIELMNRIRYFAEPSFPLLNHRL